MANELTRDLAVVGEIKTLRPGQVVKALVASITRANPGTPQVIGTLPAGATITDIRVWGPAGSNAGTTATLSIGKSGGTGAEYLPPQSVLGPAGAGKLNTSAATNLGAVGSSNVVANATYAETGTASTAGGSWLVTIEFVTNL